MIKNGVPYRYTEIDKDQGFAPQKLTSKQITEELLDRAEYERITEIGEIPY
jgi:protein-tyrosine-phosphatase